MSMEQLPPLRPSQDQRPDSCDPRENNQPRLTLVLDSWPARSDRHESSSRSRGDKASYLFWHKELEEFRQEFRQQFRNVREEMHQLFAAVDEYAKRYPGENGNSFLPPKPSTPTNSPTTPQAMEDWERLA
ncbi:uncharacterized protein TrAtP1_002931 [Trichoderma atroviride]|uniref:uncharacterized protein n=1 Tax=Hypocrea atroviridis TaxID=63577 RepID=UPI0033273537|nr:hypothetical protein TrAtP1_002931 [Trichoderma atroviride]